MIIIFSVTDYVDIHNANFFFTDDVVFYQVKLLIFCSV